MMGSSLDYYSIPLSPRADHVPGRYALGKCTPERGPYRPVSESDRELAWRVAYHYARVRGCNRAIDYANYYCYSIRNSQQLADWPSHDDFFSAFLAMGS